MINAVFKGGPLNDTCQVLLIKTDYIRFPITGIPVCCDVTYVEYKCFDYIKINNEVFWIYYLRN